MDAKNLPTISDLYKDFDSIEVAFKQDQFNFLASQHPPQSWVKEHPFAKGVKYLPIDKIEYLLRKIFKQYRIEVIGYNQLFNSVAVHVRVHYLHPVTNEWNFQDGLGAVGVQTDKGSSASDLSAIKQDAIMKALPAAESYAVKDAMEKLGNLFGASLNRKDVVAFTPDQNLVEKFGNNKQKLS